MDPLERCLRFAWSVSDAGSDEVARIAQGTVLRTPTLPDAWSGNVLRLELPAPDLSLAAAAALAARHAVVPYVEIHAEDEDTALRLLDEAHGAEGWTSERELLMLLEHVPDPPAAPVREGTPDEIQALMRRWLDEDDQTAQALDQLLERTAREHAARRERLIVAEHEGRAAAMCTVRFGEGVAQLEDVYALPHARGTGLGHAVTATAARVAADSGAEVVFIVADDRGWPKELYAKIGFAPLARRAQLHRAPAGG